METARRSEKSTERGGVTDESFTGNFKNIKSPGVLLRDVPKRDAGALNNTWRDDLVQIGDKQYRTGRNDADLRVCRRCRQRLFPQRMDRIPGGGICRLCCQQHSRLLYPEINSNAVISGIALNTFASGGTIFVLYLITGEKGASTSLESLKLPSLTIPVVKDIPVIGAVLSGHHVLTYTALVLVAVVWYMFKYTRLGMHIRAVGESPDAAESVGIPVKRIKYIALCLSGILTGMAGAFLSMGYVGLFSSGMTAGRGYIALATQAIAAGNAVIGMLASLLFGFCQSLANYLQNSSIPLQFIQMMPYLIIIIAYTIYCAMVEHNKKKKQMKAAAGK